MGYVPVRYVKQPEGIALKYSLVYHKRIPVASSDLNPQADLVVGRRVSNPDVLSSIFRPKQMLPQVRYQQISLMMVHFLQY